MAALWLVSLPSPVAASNDEPTERVQQAVVEALKGRFGEAAAVTVTVGQVRLVDGHIGALEARPAPGARLARPTRFTLYQKDPDGVDADARVGYAVAEAHVAIEHARAAHDIDRGRILGAGDLVTTVGDIGAVPMKALPTELELVGALAARALRSGDLMTDSVITMPKLVRARESVVVTVQIGAVHVSGRATAMESGELGEVISLLNERSGRRLNGRVVAFGEVEVVR